jgi:hypothetical protein
MRRAALIAVALAGPATVASTAGAATLTLDHGCYLAKQPALKSGQAIVARAEGFVPGAGVLFALPTGGVAYVAADATGTAVASFSAPGLPSGQFAATRTLTASDNTNHASARLRLRVMGATFLPANTSNAATQKVRFYVYGFGPLLTVLKRPTTQDVYMHVFQPGGKLRGTFKVGRSAGACGDLRTGRRKILPFGLKTGTWDYRFTTAKRYSAKALPQASVGFRVQTVFRPA